MIDDPKLDKELAAMAMYWCGDSYTKMSPADSVKAYRMFKKLTWNYPESQWAKHARARLTDRNMVTIEEQEAKLK